MAAHAIWKGAISFGLVNVPIALYPASSDSGVDFDWLDKRTMDPVGYQRINKRTREPIESDDIVKGVKLESGDYVVLSEDEVKAAYPKSTQTIEIDRFTEAAGIPLTYFDRPYFVEPVGKSAKVYALLREAMAQQGVVGIARVVMHTKEHLAALVTSGEKLMLHTLRWQQALRSPEDLDRSGDGAEAVALKPAELKMAGRLIGEMTEAFRPEAYHDTFSDAVMTLVRQRAEAGDTEGIQPLEEAPAASADVLDLTELLKRSLGRRESADQTKATAASKPVASASAGRAAKPAAKRPASSASSGKPTAPARKRA